MSLPFEIDIAIHSDLWSNNSALFQKTIIHEAIAAALKVLKTPRLCELSIVLSDDDQIQTLNRDYRDKDKATNVLSFSIAPPAPMLGDIILAFETVQKEAKDKGISFENHMAHLLIHGFLHLQGYDHIKEEDAARMEALEIKALALLNIDNPYLY